MDKGDFAVIRRELGKTQRQMAQLLGTSQKAVQSFEQGWRKVTPHIEKQMLFLLAMKKAFNRITIPCWVIKECSHERRQDCPAWEFQIGTLCWFINGTICQGEAQESWPEKMKLCRKCEMFCSLFPTLDI